eukprot:1394759-Amorphochlora_amoeboformis.AAC.3
MHVLFTVILVILVILGERKHGSHGPNSSCPQGDYLRVVDNIRPVVWEEEMFWLACHTECLDVDLCCSIEAYTGG